MAQDELLGLRLRGCYYPSLPSQFEDLAHAVRADRYSEYARSLLHLAGSLACMDAQGLAALSVAVTEAIDEVRSDMVSANAENVAIGMVDVLLNVLVLIAARAGRDSDTVTLWLRANRSVIAEILRRGGVVTRTGLWLEDSLAGGLVRLAAPCWDLPSGGQCVTAREALAVLSGLDPDGASGDGQTPSSSNIIPEIAGTRGPTGFGAPVDSTEPPKKEEVGEARQSAGLFGGSGERLTFCETLRAILEGRMRPIGLPGDDAAELSPGLHSNITDGRVQLVGGASASAAEEAGLRRMWAQLCGGNLQQSAGVQRTTPIWGLQRSHPFDCFVALDAATLRHSVASCLLASVEDGMPSLVLRVSRSDIRKCGLSPFAEGWLESAWKWIKGAAKSLVDFFHHEETPEERRKREEQEAKQKKANEEAEKRLKKYLDSLTPEQRKKSAWVLEALKAAGLIAAGHLSELRKKLEEAGIKFSDAGWEAMLDALTDPDKIIVVPDSKTLAELCGASATQDVMGGACMVGGKIIISQNWVHDFDPNDPAGLEHFFANTVQALEHEALHVLALQEGLILPKEHHSFIELVLGAKGQGRNERLINEIHDYACERLALKCKERREDCAPDSENCGLECQALAKQLAALANCLGLSLGGSDGLLYNGPLGATDPPPEKGTFDCWQIRPAEGIGSLACAALDCPDGTMPFLEHGRCICRASVAAAALERACLAVECGESETAVFANGRCLCIPALGEDDPELGPPGGGGGGGIGPKVKGALRWAEDLSQWVEQ